MKSDFLFRFVIVLFSIFLLMAILCFALSLRFNTTSSMPIGIYQVDKKTVSHLSRGDLVEVCLPDHIAKFAFERNYLSVGRCANGIEPVIKQVVGIQGDAVNVQQNGVSINQKLFPHSQLFSKDRQGRPLFSMLKGQFILKPNQVFLYGTNDVYSFDSRYFGAIDAKYIQSVLKPVLVFDNSFSGKL